MAEPEPKSLEGKRVVITRAADQSADLIAALEARGAEVLLLPVVSFAPPENWNVVDEHLRRLDSFDAILFLSANAVRYVFGRANELNLKVSRSDGASLFIAAVGPATARAISDQGAHADYVAREHTGRALAEELKAVVARRSVLLPRSERGNEAVPDALRDAGANVTEFVAYRNLLPSKVDPEILKTVLRAEVDVVVFASPSAVYNFTLLLGGAERKDLAGRLRFASIGPTTAQALRDAKLPVSAQAADSSAAALVAAIERL